MLISHASNSNVVAVVVVIIIEALSILFGIVGKLHINTQPSLWMYILHINTHPTVSHLQFADDTIIFCEATED